MPPLRLGLPAPVTGRIGALDELKGLAIILVVLYHAGGVLGLADTLHLEVGVDIFVILSGVGLTLGAGGEGAGRFILRRFWRIYPTYWIALTAFIAAGAYLRGDHVTAADAALHYLGIHAWFGDAHAMSINDSFWFITLIVSLYLLYVPLRRLSGRPDRLLLAGSLISLVAILAYFHWGQAAVFSHLALRLPGFFAGLLIGTLLRTGSLVLPLSPALAGALFILFYVTYAQGIVIMSFLIGLVVMSAYAFLARPLLGPAVLADLRFLGDRSLGIFLIHQPLIREYNVYVLNRFFPGAVANPWALAAGMAVGIVLTVLIASGLHSFLRGIAIPGAAQAAYARTGISRSAR
jgi:peptidoglycan/LPS O-acetylase OafA/YrhL